MVRKGSHFYDIFPARGQEKVCFPDQVSADGPLHLKQNKCLTYFPSCISADSLSCCSSLLKGCFDVRTSSCLFLLYILTSLAVHPDKITIATGQVAGTSSDGKVSEIFFRMFKYCIQIYLIWCFHLFFFFFYWQQLAPHVRVWDSVSLNTLHILGSGFFDRGLVCLAFSKSVRKHSWQFLLSSLSVFSLLTCSVSFLAWFYDVRMEGTRSVSSTTPMIMSSRSGTGRGRTDWLKLRSVYFCSFNLLLVLSCLSWTLFILCNCSVLQRVRVRCRLSPHRQQHHSDLWQVPSVFLDPGERRHAGKEARIVWGD